MSQLPRPWAGPLEHRRIFVFTVGQDDVPIGQSAAARIKPNLVAFSGEDEIAGVGAGRGYDSPIWRRAGRDGVDMTTASGAEEPGGERY